MITPEMVQYFKTTAREKIERLTAWGLLLGLHRNLTEDEFSNLKAELEEMTKLYGLFNTVLGRQEALMQLLPVHLNYTSGLSSVILERLRETSSQAAERLLVLGLTLELVGIPRNLTTEDYSQLREGIAILKRLVISSLQLAETPTGSTSVPPSLREAG